MGKKSVFALIAIATIFLFQNCGKAGFEDQAQMDLATSSTVSSDAKVIAAPFPYETGANVVAYMSCPTVSQTTNNEAYFSFKILGSEPTVFNSISNAMRNAGQASSALPLMAEGGIRLHADYLTYMDKNFKGLKTNIPTEQLEAALRTHPDYQNAHLQIGFRKRSDLRNVVLNYPSSNGGSSQAAAQYVFDKLSSPVISQSMALSRDKYVTTFPKNATDLQAFTSTISYATPSETDMTNFRSSLLGNEYYLTLSFIKDAATAGSSGIQLNAFPGGTDGIKGKGFALQFGNPTPPATLGVAPSYVNDKGTLADNSLKPRAVIPTRSGVTEYDLETNSPISGTWNCSSYAIVRFQDREICPVEDYVNIKRGNLDLVRKILKAEDWQVNTTLGCIVPTGSNGAFSCYSQNTGANPPAERTQWTGSTTPTVIAPHPFGTNYTFTGAATSGVEYRYWTQNCGGQYRECVNFATFCYKQQ